MSFAVVAALAVAAVPAARQGAAALAQPGRDPTLLHRHADQIIQAKDVEQEQALRRLLALGGSDAELAEVTQRLANLLRARALSLTIRAQAEADESDTSAAERDRVVAQAARTEAVQLYRQLLRKHPRAPRLDAALFFLADALQDSGKDAEAVTAARELVRRFPNSQWAPASHVFIGEHLFDAARLSEALVEYRAAAAVETDEVYPYALYKAAWCRFNQGGFDDAMKLLQKVVAVSLGGDSAHPVESGEPSKVQLAREARRDYVIAYARSGKPDNARDDFAARFGLAPGRKMLEQYAKLLFDQGRDPEAQLVHRQLLEIHGDRSGAALDQTRLLMIAARGGKRKDLLREAQALVDVFHRVQKREARKGDEAEQLEEASNHAEETLRNLAVSIHNEARKTHLEDTWAAAKALYADYLTLFPDAPDAYDLRFFDAELLFGLGEKAKAADLYEEVVRQDLAAVQAGRSARRWLQQAAWDAVLSRAVAGDAARGAHAAQRPMTPDEEKLSRACALYLQVLPGGPHAVEVAFKLGRLEYVSGKLDEARKHLSWIALSHPEHELAEYAANLVLDIENLRKDYTSVRAWAKRFLADPRLVAHGTLQQDLTRVEEQSAYAMADAVQGDVAKAEALLAFVSEHPKGALADKAIFGAAAAYSRAGRIDDALAARARLWKEFPTSTLVARALLASAADTATVGDFGESASLLERYFAGYRKEREARRKRAFAGIYEGDRARAALHDAAVLREARGELQRSLQDRQAAVQAWPKTADEAAQKQEIALLRARLGEPARAARELAALARAAHADPALGISGWAEAARLFTQVRETDHAQWAWAELEKAIRALPQKARDKLPPAALSAAAEAHLALGDGTFDAFRKQAIKPPLAQTLARKIDLLQRVKKRAEETVAMRQASPAVCALQRLGEAQMLLAQAIEQSAAPRELNSEQRKLYRAALADKARPLYDEARETLRAADGKAHELGVSGECVAHTVALLEKLGAKPGNRAQLEVPVEEISAVPDLVDAAGRPVESDVEPVPRASVIKRTAVGAPAAQVASQGTSAGGNR